MIENEIDSIIKEIANAINDIIPVKWVNAYFYGEVGEHKESHTIGMYFYNKKQRKYMDFTEIPDVYPEFNGFSLQFSKLNTLTLSLYDLFPESGMKPWEAILIEIDKKGKLKLNFSYDWFSIGEDEFARKILWANRTFGFTPQKGGYAEKIINSHKGDK
jgi:hypothetical protein